MLACWRRARAGLAGMLAAVPVDLTHAPIDSWSHEAMLVGGARLRIRDEPPP